MKYETVQRTASARGGAKEHAIGIESNAVGTTSFEPVIEPPQIFGPGASLWLRWDQFKNNAATDITDSAVA